MSCRGVLGTGAAVLVTTGLGLIFHKTLQTDPDPAVIGALALACGVWFAVAAARCGVDRE